MTSRADEEKEEQPIEKPVTAVATTRARVLVVDDEPMVGKALSRMLKGLDVTVLTDAREACARVDAGERFDLILCDLMMPEMTGMALHAELSRKAPELASRMVFITGGAFTPTASAFLDRVSNERIDKPFEAASLQRLVQRILG